MCVLLRMCMHVYVHVYVCMCMHVYVCVYIICMCVYVLYVCICTCVGMCLPALWLCMITQDGYKCVGIYGVYFFWHTHICIHLVTLWSITSPHLPFIWQIAKYQLVNGHRMKIQSDHLAIVLPYCLHNLTSEILLPLICLLSFL